MLLDLIFIAAGFAAFSKKEIKITAKRTISGSQPKKIGILFLSTGLLGQIASHSDDLAIFNPTFFNPAIIKIIQVLYLAGIVASVLFIIYLILFKKNIQPVK